MIIYYNPECSKCQEARQLLEGKNCQLEIRNYLEIPPTREELKELVQKLGCPVSDLIRKTEAVFLEKFSDKTYSDEEWMQMIVQHPVLLQRPIVIDGEKAIIGRPAVLVLDLVKDPSR